MARPGGVTTSSVTALRDRLLGIDELRRPVVVACSGGPDSSALLVLAEAVHLAPIAVHVDHGLRPGSDDEARVVEELAGRLGVRFCAEQAQVDLGPNLEARARHARYAALERARVTWHASAVLVGHTADDQAETVLLNLMRGSAAAGLGAMPVVREHLARPMLGLRRAETEALCAELGLEPVRDPSNDDTDLRRNWVRNVALPVLSEGADRDLVPLLARQAAILREDSEFLDRMARALWPPDAHRASAALAALPPALARRAVRQWLGPPPPSFDEVERVLTVARGEVRATEIAGGRRVRRSDGRLHVDPPG